MRNSSGFSSSLHTAQKVLGNGLLPVSSDYEVTPSVFPGVVSTSSADVKEHIWGDVDWD